MLNLVHLGRLMSARIRGKNRGNSFKPMNNDQIGHRLMCPRVGSGLDKGTVWADELDGVSGAPTT